MFTHLLTTFSASAACRGHSFFGLKPWYYYLKTDPQCNVINFHVLGVGGKSDFALILVVIVDDLLRVAGLVAVGFIIFGGIQYITSQGSPDATGKAQNTIQDALIGLIIAIIAIALVSFLGAKLGA